VENAISRNRIFMKEIPLFIRGKRILSPPVVLLIPPSGPKYYGAVIWKK